MSHRKSPKLPLDLEERDALRGAGVPLYRLHETEPEALAEVTGLSVPRCRQLIALASFQTLGSVGPESADDLWRLGFRSLHDLAGADPAAMYERMNRRVGHRVDPCVEDVFRCAVAQATHPDLPAELRQWWSWQEQRGEPEVRLPEEDGD